MNNADVTTAVATGESVVAGSEGRSAACCSWGRRCREGCVSFARKINAEPVILLSMTAYGLIATIKPLFLYWARCIQIFSHRPDMHIENVTQFCLNLTSQNNTDQDIVERDIATWAIYLQLGSSVPTLLISPILGAWADGSGGRKKPLILSLVGLTIYGGLQVAATATFKILSVYPFMLLAELIAGFCGGVMTLFATSFAIATDDSRDEMRHGDSTVALRIGIASAFQVLGAIIGGILASVCTSVFPREEAYIVGAFIACCLMLLTVLYTVFLVKETHKEIAELEESARHVSGRDDTSVSLFARCFGTECWNVTKKKGLSVIQVLIEKREGWTRFCLNMSLVFVFVEVFALDSSLLVLITKRPPFSWSDKTWTIYSIFKNLTFTLGMIVFPLMIARTNWLGKDSILIMTGILSAAVVSILVSFARTTELLFICAALGFFAGGISPGFRSFIPRMVRKDETARLFTAFGGVIALCPILSALLFNSIFNATLHFWPSFVFLVAGIIMLAVLCGQCVTHYLMRSLWLRHSGEGFEPLVADADDDISDTDDTHRRRLQNAIT
uniref:Uncharacterized protein n=2 Tax=Plectus sambesii TaxID=2011161 RepID=A0A914WMB6_9BILA